jgi:hypothetical protein
MLRRRSSGVARHSQHMLGHAMDLFIPGVPLEQIRFAGLRLQRGGVGFYPTSGSPFVHLDTGSIRHWPRMSRDQLARVFPDGRTVHVPSDGVPLKGYELALADIQRRGRSSDGSGSAPGAKTLLAALFGSSSSSASDDEDESNATPASPTPARPATIAAAKPTDSVPLPRIRPAGDASYQVAAATAPITTGGIAASEPKPHSIADIINSRGFWDEARMDPQASEALRATSLKARFAETFAQSTASADAVDVKPWSADDRSAAAPQALGYAAASAAVSERPRVVTASAPIPVSVRPVTAAAPVRIDSVVMKGEQPVPTNAAQGGVDPWMRATMLAPNFQYAMHATAFGDPDMTALRALFVKPAVAIAMSFASEPTPGLSCDRFDGSAMANPPLVSLRAQPSPR